jgi:hypothetical protein
VKKLLFKASSTDSQQAKVSIDKTLLKLLATLNKAAPRQLKKENYIQDMKKLTNTSAMNLTPGRSVSYVKYPDTNSVSNSIPYYIVFLLVKIAGTFLTRFRSTRSILKRREFGCSLLFFVAFQNQSLNVGGNLLDDRLLKMRAWKKCNCKQEY